MFDIRPIGYVIGILVAAMGASMSLPLVVDLYFGNDEWQAFAVSSFVTALSGLLMMFACANGVRQGLSIQQTFLMTTGVWFVLPFFGAIPFCIGDTDARFTDGFFEAMSGLTTTGSTVFSGLDKLPEGLLLWRGLLQWFGGIGIIVVAMVFLPLLRVGGMQIFRSESFDTFGKILPRAAEIARSIFSIYFGLTAAAFVIYTATGLRMFDAGVHAMTTIATGGFGNYDDSFAHFGAATEYASVVFMLLAALPFVRYVQLSGGSFAPLFQDTQIRAFFMTVGVCVALILAWITATSELGPEVALRKALFNGVSILTGTGFSSANYGEWGSFAVVMFFTIGLIGGCAGSTTCSIKIFRFQLLFASIKVQAQRLHSPRGVFPPRYGGRAIGDDILSSVMAFFVLFFLTLAVVTLALATTGLDLITSLSGAATALANIGPGLGDQIGPSGNFSSLSDPAKWILSFAMLIGRLELMAVFAIFSFAFWRS
jgi:trk system potassium uptake protein TrkH